MKDKKLDIRTLSRENLTEYFESIGEKKFRANQVYQWLWQKSAVSFDEMTNLSKDLRSSLEENFIINPIKEDLRQRSSDGTIKCRFKTHDSHLIEGVIIPAPGRMTACISSQVGCSLSCSFCATGFLKLKRNLLASEIYDQVVLLNRIALEEHRTHLTNIVYMGMGEPLLNYKEVLRSTELIIGEEGLGMAARRITVSTAGIAKMIRNLGDDKVRFNLALSLHAPDDIKRNQIMAINESNSLDTLIDALNYFYDNTGNRITFEYILFNKFNDSIEDAGNLVNLCRRVPTKVNLIEYNPVDGVRMTKSDSERRERFVSYLEKHRVTAVVRRSRGKDIDAACGQLANK